MMDFGPGILDSIPEASAEGKGRFIAFFFVFLILSMPYERNRLELTVF